MNFVEICIVCTRKAVIKAAKRIFNSDKICRSYCDYYFGVTFLEHSVCVCVLTARLTRRLIGAGVYCIRDSTFIRTRTYPHGGVYSRPALRRLFETWRLLEFGIYAVARRSVS